MDHVIGAKYRYVNFRRSSQSSHTFATICVFKFSFVEGQREIERERVRKKTRKSGCVFADVEGQRERDG